LLLEPGGLLVPPSLLAPLLLGLLLGEVLLSRRARSLAVWATLAAYGRNGYRAIVERSLDVAAHVAREVEAADDFELLAPAPLSIVCFRYRPAGLPEEALDELNLAIGRAVLTDGRVYVGTTRWAGTVGFRPAFVNWRTTTADADLMLKTVRDLGRLQHADLEQSGPRPQRYLLRRLGRPRARGRHDRRDQFLRQQRPVRRERVRRPRGHRGIARLPRVAALKNRDASMLRGVTPSLKAVGCHNSGCTCKSTVSADAHRVLALHTAARVTDRLAAYLHPEPSGQGSSCHLVRAHVVRFPLRMRLPLCGVLSHQIATIV
jgi:Pyridoxal-dependent decarboxylase conserved domain